MAYLRPTPLELTGGCFCSAIKYKISIPSLTDRPLVPGALDTPLLEHASHADHSSRQVSSDGSAPTRLPLIPLDHCSDCRRILGAIVQCWLICPQTWVKWDLLHKTSSASPSEESRSTLSTDEVVYSDTHYLSAFQSTPDDGTNGCVTRTFCSRCGTTLTFAFKASDGSMSRSLSAIDVGEGEVGEEFPALVNVTVGSLDHASLEKVRPDRQGWWDYGVGWVKELLSRGDGGLMRHNGDAGSRVGE
jgi:hypothetical protein